MVLSNNTHRKRRHRENTTETDTALSQCHTGSITGQGLPEIDTVVLQSDGSYQQNNDLAGIGFIITKQCGTPIHEEWGYADTATTSVETEAAALLRAVQTAQLFSPTQIAAYTDCQPVISHIQSHSDTDESQNRYVLINKLFANTQCTSVNYVPAENNCRADELAAIGLRKLRERRSK